MVAHLELLSPESSVSLAILASMVMFPDAESKSAEANEDAPFVAPSATASAMVSESAPPITLRPAVAESGRVAETVPVATLDTVLLFVT